MVGIPLKIRKIMEHGLASTEKQASIVVIVQNLYDQMYLLAETGAMITSKVNQIEIIQIPIKDEKTFDDIQKEPDTLSEKLSDLNRRLIHINQQYSLVYNHLIKTLG